MSDRLNPYPVPANPISPQRERQVQDDRVSSLSVCLLTYNHAHLLESTLKSALDQSISDYEIIVSDDCSTDSTWERILNFAAREPRIRPIRTPRNMGMAGNANFAVAHTNKEFVALLHHDDLYRHDLLEKWLSVMRESDDIGFVFNAYGHHDGKVDLFEPNPGSGRMDGKWFLTKVLFAGWGCAVRGTALVRRSAWKQVGGMQEKFGLLADVDLWMRLAARGAVGYVAEPLIELRQDRPEYYPDQYKSGTWSWTRHRLLLEIHGANQTEYFANSGPPGWIRVQWFRLRLSMETTKWLAYGIVRGKREVIRTAARSKTKYDMFWLRILRRILVALYRIG